MVERSVKEIPFIIVESKNRRIISLSDWLGIIQINIEK